jgi:glycosyltransferase involved in cell wall biosynthesis
MRPCSRAERTHSTAAGGTVVQILLGELSAPRTKPQVLHRPRQTRRVRGERQQLADDLHRLARVAVAVDLARERLHQDFTATGGRTQTVALVGAHARHFSGARRRIVCNAVRILIFHGYLLSGTGSNVYNARLSEALVRLGHEVHLFSQDRHPERQRFVSACGHWQDGRLQLTQLDRPRDVGPGRCTVYRPDIGGLLPLYVQDRYEGIEAKTFANCTDAEIAVYVQANVDAVRELAERVSPELALANHLVMGPAILARALEQATPYAVKVHGSALEYTVKPEPQRFLAYAREGLAGAKTVLVGSRHTAESLWRALEDASVERRTRLGPPGVDVERFAPRDREHADAGLRELLEGLRQSAPTSSAEQSSAFARDDEAAAAALERISTRDGDLVAFVGKLIVSKGVDLLIAAWPLVLQSVPDAQLAIVGFGAYRAALERLIQNLQAGDLEGAQAIARAGRTLEGEAGEEAGAGDEGEGGGKAGDGDQGKAGGGDQGEADDDDDDEGKAGGGDQGEAGDDDEGEAGDRDGAEATAQTTPAVEAVPLRHLLAFLTSLTEAEAETYRSAARVLGERIVFTGRLDHEELADVLPACEALVVPSTFPEAFGMVAVEGAACGALPVSAGHSGLAEVSEAIAEDLAPQTAAWLSFPVDDDSVRAIAERLVAWLTADPALKLQTKQALVSVARERWSWEGVARGVIAAARGEPVTRPFG